MVFGRAQAQAACKVDTFNGVTGYLVVSGCNPGEFLTGRRAKGPAPAGVTNDGGCVGYSVGQYYAEFSDGTFTPTPGPGQCEQIDISTSGVAKFGGASKVCGDACTSNADCKNPSANGAPVACVAGTCQNTLCAVGKTIPGANCSCGANARLCGQTCSGALGLCAPGQGTCTYVNTAGPYCPFGWSQTYCAGASNGYTRAACTTGDSSGGGYLVGPTGKTSGFTAAEIAASCQVCGNGTVETGEQCDMGTSNGTPNSGCTTTCQKVSCNQACTTDAQCGGISHKVQLIRNAVGTTGINMSVDYVLDGTVYADGSPTLVTGGATWSSVADATTHGGSYLNTALAGGTLTYNTYSSKIIVRTMAGAKASGFNVYVDGVLKQTYTPSTTTSGWVDYAVTVAANQYTCTTVGTAKMCRLTSNPSSSTCTTTTTTPTPTPAPTSLVCDLTPTFTSTGNVSNWKYGDSITYSVGAVPATRIPAGGSVRYEGEYAAYRGTTLMKKLALTPINATASKFNPIKVEYGNSTYYFHFRYCVKTSAGVETCSPWGAWAVPATTATPSPVACATPPVCPVGSSLITGTPQNGGCLQYTCLTNPTPISTTKTIRIVKTSAVGNLNVDAVILGTTTLQESNTALKYVGTWTSVADPILSGGTKKFATAAASEINFTTTASIVKFISIKSPTEGLFDVYVNGVKKTLTPINLYGSVTQYQYAVDLSAYLQ